VFIGQTWRAKLVTSYPPNDSERRIACAGDVYLEVKSCCQKTTGLPPGASLFWYDISDLVMPSLNLVSGSSS